MKYLIILFLLPLNFFSQTKYYQFKRGKPITEEKYNEVKSNLSEKGSLDETIVKIENRNDSIIYHTRFVILPKDEGGQSFNPYGDTKKLIGTKFSIKNFRNKNGKFYSNNKLKGKPTLINFWFTRCPPCIDEIPILNNLKKTYGENVNLIAITFDKKKTVDEFLKKTIINLEHITDSKTEIDKLKISAYPTTLILDKNGIIRHVYGELSSEEDDLKMIIDDLKK